MVLPGEGQLLVTCEHGGNEVPEAYAPLFVGREAEVASHRGWDPGALDLARRIAGATGAPMHASTLSRLVVDLNRSPHNPRVFSPVTRALSPSERAVLLEAFHGPYRARVAADVARGAERGTVLHLSIHTFTPVLDGVPRDTDLALLYDPRRRPESRLAGAWADALRAAGRGLRIRRNHPYRGRSDGLTTWLRTRHAADRYLGIEVEACQGMLGGRARFPPGLEALLVDTLSIACRGDAGRSIFGG